MRTKKVTERKQIMPKEKPVKLSQQYEIRFGTLSVHRGRDDNKKPLFSWEPIPDCTNEDCPLHDKCEYNSPGKCKVVAGIVKSAAINIVENYGNKMSNAVRNRVGQHLMPLYVNLAKLYVYEASLNSPVYTDLRGYPRVNMVYKEIRETIRGIDLQWKNLGLISGSIADDKGMGNWYENMEKNDLRELKKKQKIRLVKKN